MLDQLLVIVAVTALVMVTPGPDMAYPLDRPVIRRSVERSQLTVNRISGALLIVLGVRVAISR